MANGNGEEQDDVVLTERGAVPREEFEIQQAAGTAAPEVSGQELLELGRQQIVQQTADAPIQTALESAIGTVTFGATNLLAGAEEREERRRRAEASPTAATVGSVVGSVAPALLSGGAGVAGTLARLTPSGQLAAATGRFASGSQGLARVARTALGGAAEGAVEGLGQELANITLQDDPRFSGDALAASIGGGALLGGALGGALDAAGLAAGRIARRNAPLTDIPLGFDEQALRALDQPSLVGGVPPRIPDIETRAVVGDRVDVPTSFRELVGHVDDDAARAFGAATEDLANVRSQLDRLGVDDSVRSPIVDSLDELGIRYQRASNDAKEWITRVNADVPDLANATPAQLSRQLPDELEDEGIVRFAALDDAGDQWRAASAEVKDALTGAVNDANAASVAGGAPSGLGERLAGVTQSLRQRLSGGGLATAVGTVEAARDLGVDIPLPSVRDIPGVGGAISLYTKFRAGANAARRVGVLPSTPSTRSAARVNTTRDRISSAVSNVGRRVARAAVTPAVASFTRASGRRIAQEVGRMRSQDPEDLHVAIQEQVDGPPEVAAAAADAAIRAHQYMLENAPKNPFEGTQAEGQWVPTTREQHEWRVRRQALAKPEATIRESMSGGLRDISVDAIRAVYPALYEFTQTQLTAQRQRLQKTLPQSTLQSIGRMYQIPMTIQQEPGYQAATQAVFAARDAQAAQGILPRAVNPVTSAIGTLDAVADERR